MKIIISNTSFVPIYLQIKENIIKQILDDDLKSDEPLPSIRNLAKDIGISVMTIKKAYDELEKEGYIKSIQGKGTFISPKNSNLILENANKEIEKNIKEAINIASKYNISKEDLIDLINILYRSYEDE